MHDQTTSEHPSAERDGNHATGRQTTSTAIWVVLAVSLSVPLGGAIAGFVLSPGFDPLEPFFLIFSLVSFASALLGAAGTTLVTANQ